MEGNAKERNETGRGEVNLRADSTDFYSERFSSSRGSPLQARGGGTKERRRNKVVSFIKILMKKRNRLARVRIFVQYDKIFGEILQLSPFPLDGINALELGSCPFFGLKMTRRQSSVA